MKVLVLCGIFDEVAEAEVLQQARRAVEFSANLMQQKLVGAFKGEVEDISVLSAPFLGAYPTASSRFSFRGFEKCSGEYTYVSFNNLWGVRNFSRTAALKKALRDFIRAEDADKFLLIYCPHTPFLKAADYAKRRDGRIRTCLYVPDLPQYMNLSARISPIYKIAKYFDIRSMTRAMRSVDSFVLLTEQMKDKLPVEHKPYFVCEALVTQKALEAARLATGVREGARDIVYTGKLDLRFGLQSLLEAMEHLAAPDCRLILCGTGDAFQAAREAAKKDPRICVCGQVTPQKAAEYRQGAAVLVNPRTNDEEYTKYSFPSKISEYLLSGVPVVAHLLDGMPSAYRDFLQMPSDSSPRALAEALDKALSLPRETARQKHLAFLSYAEKHLLASSVVKHCLTLGE